MPHPIAFKIGSWPIYWYGILLAIAVFSGTVLLLRAAEKEGLNQEHLLNIILVVVPVAFLGARLYYVFFKWSYYSRYPREILAVWHGGLAIHGGLIAGFLAAFFLLRKYKINFGQAADLAAPSVVLGQAIGRWGNFFNQEAFGYELDPTVYPWAMYIQGAYRHPTFLYESLWNLSIFFFLLYLRRKKDLPQGHLFLLYLVFYSVGRFFIEGLRTDSLMLTANLRVAQVVSLLVIGLGLFLLGRRRKT